jgi:hypothetical protein
MHGPFRYRLAALSVAAIAATASALPARSAQTGPGGLTSSQVAQLRTQPLPIVLPQYIPAGFHLVQFETDNVKHRDPANGYELHYRSADGREFFIVVGDSGLGDADPDLSSYRRPFVVSSSLIGSTTMSPYHFMGPQGSSQPWSWGSDYRSLARLGNAKAVLTFGGTISPDELRRIYSSLQQVSR